MLQLAFSLSLSIACSDSTLPSRRCACAYEWLRIEIKIRQHVYGNIFVLMKFEIRSRPNFRQRKPVDLEISHELLTVAEMRISFPVTHKCAGASRNTNLT